MAAHAGNKPLATLASEICDPASRDGELSPPSKTTALVEEFVKDVMVPTGLPHPTEYENDFLKRWFEDKFFARICVQEFLKIAKSSREGDHTCRFGQRVFGALHIAIFIIFDDGVQWVAKIPKWNVDEGGETNMFLLSEYATLVFLQEIDTIPTPKVHAASFDANNPTKTSYYMMEKLPGVPISQACRENKMERVAVFEMLRQLAEVRKTLARHTWPEIGSLSMAEDNVVVERQVTNKNYFDGWAKIRSRPGPFSSSITYYANLLNQSWTAAQNTFPDSTEAWVRWKVHAYLCSILSSYVEPDVNQFILAHTDLNPSNILVDPQTGAITDIIDWEFACTVPLQAPEHFPLLLRQRVFTNEFDDVYDDPEAELNEWRSFYAKQFEGDPAMEEYLQNVDAAIAFENILKNNDLATIENLVEKCKFLESAETLETMVVPFPSKSPTKHRSPSPPTTKPESETTLQR
jgi:serine/threonine protein kinase